MSQSKSTTTEPKPLRLVEVDVHPLFENAVRLRYTDYTGQFDVWWGDHKGKNTGTGGSTSYMTHVYPRPGTYTIQVYKSGGAAPADFLDAVTVVVRGGKEPKGIAFAINDQDPNLVEAVFSDTEDGTDVPPRFHIEWPEGEPEDVWGIPGTKTARVLKNGTYKIKVTDTTSQLWGEYDVTVVGVQYNPNFTVTKAPQQDGANRKVRVTFTKVDNKPVTIYWTANGDATTKVPAPKVNDTHDHTYGQDGSYPILVAYDDGSTVPPEGLSLNATVPWSASA